MTRDLVLVPGGRNQWLSALNVLLGKIAALRGFDLYATLTLFLLLLYSDDSPWIRIPITVLCILAFIFVPLRRSAKFWFVVALLVLVSNYQNWYQADNHKYLHGYWCVALFCALHTRDPERSAGIAARWLIGLTFLWAVFWKLSSDDYLNGSFFHFSLLIDERFHRVAQGLGGLTERMNELNHAAYRALVNYDSHLSAVGLASGPAIAGVAALMTWWTLILEALIAVAFLWPEEKFISKWRDYFLLLFILTTYLVAPVVGFGWVLAIMGLAQTSNRSALLTLLYIVTFVSLQVYRLPQLLLP